MSPAPRSPDAWREGVNKDQQCADEDYARSTGRELDDYRAAATVRLCDLLDGAEVRMRMREYDLEGWLDEGVFETAHGAGNTSGTNDLHLRIEVEAKVLGVHADATDPERPRYGYAQGSGEGDVEINQYGKILVRFRDRVREHATVMLGDSIGSTRSSQWQCMAPEPLCAPELPCRFSLRDVVKANRLVNACDPDYRYAEVQIYCPLSPVDITEVVFCDGVRAPRGLRHRLDDWGVAFYELNDYPT